MMKRRTFLRAGTLAGIGLAVRDARAAFEIEEKVGAPARGPRALSTHPTGLVANRTAARILAEGGSALDAAQQGAMVIEADPEDTSVGYGGYPNIDGVVQLDAAIMDGRKLEAGSVAALEEIKHPVAVARLVLDETPHVLLVGDGARAFALRNGFKAEDLLTPKSRKAWKERTASSAPPNEKNHDTLGIITQSADGRMAAACTTSGLAWKLPGRVGDSPLIGHGLYCDDAAGGAVATGIGEEVIKVCGSYQVVEFMRQGLHPQEAIGRVLDRMLHRNPANRDDFIGLVAMRADGEIGYAATTDNFKAATFLSGKHHLEDAPKYDG